RAHAYLSLLSWKTGSGCGASKATVRFQKRLSKQSENCSRSSSQPRRAANESAATAHRVRATRCLTIAALEPTFSTSPWTAIHTSTDGIRPECTYQSALLRKSTLLVLIT